MKILVTLALAALALSACGAASAQAATVSDPAGDICAGGFCGPDLTGVGSRVGDDGTVFLSVTRAGSVCNTLSYPAAEVQPMFELLADGATSQADAGSYLGHAWAVSSTSDFLWTAQGSTSEVPIAEHGDPGRRRSLHPALDRRVGRRAAAEALRHEFAREFPFTPLLESKDIAPDTGLYRIEAPQPPDACRNIAGTQSSVPAGLSPDGSGNGAAHACPNTAGVQATVPSGHPRGPSGQRTRVHFTGTAGRDTIRGQCLANRITGGAGLGDRLFVAVGPGHAARRSGPRPALRPGRSGTGRRAGPGRTSSSEVRAATGSPGDPERHLLLRRWGHPHRLRAANPRLARHAGDAAIR